MWNKVVDRAPVEVRESPNAVVGALAGATFLFAGVVAFAISMGGHLATSPGYRADGLGGAHCASYVVVGLVLLAGMLAGRARLVNTAVGASYLTLGLVLLGSEGGPQLLTLHEPDNVLHLLGAAVLVGFGRTQE